MWCELDTQLRQRPSLEPRKVKAHLTLQEVLEGTISFDNYVGNGVADAVATAAANHFEEPPPVLRAAEKDFGIAVMLSKRLACIEAACWEAAAAKEVAKPTFPPLPSLINVEHSIEAEQKKIRDRGH